MLGFLAPLAIQGVKFLASKAFKAAGGHIAQAAVQKVSGVPVTASEVGILETVVSGLGSRVLLVALGAGVTFYGTNHDFRAGIDLAIKAVAEAVF